MTIQELIKKHLDSLDYDNYINTDSWKGFDGMSGYDLAINDLIAKLPEIEKEIVGEIEDWYTKAPRYRTKKDLIAHLTNKDNLHSKN